MMLNYQALPDWESRDAAALRDFLQSSTGQKALAHISADAPLLLDGADVNKTLVASGQYKGYAAALENLVRLTFEQPKPERVEETYPSLDDESVWVNKITNQSVNSDNSIP